MNISNFAFIRNFLIIKKTVSQVEMNKVLVIGPNYFHYPAAVCDAFGHSGYDPVFVGFDTPVTPYHIINKIKWKFTGDKTSLIQKSRLGFNRSIISKFEKESPDLVFVINGDFLDTETSDLFRRHSKVVLWLFDNRERLGPAVDALASHVDALYSFDMKDVSYFNGLGLQAGFLPQACDTITYHPLEAVSRDIDVLFVGNMLFSDKRKRLIKKLVEAFPDKRIEVYGLYAPWYKGLSKWLFRPYRRIIRNREVTPRQVNTLYNRSKVVVNIHAESQGDGANPKVFEICGAGAYQVCDSNAYVRTLFPDGGIGLYTDGDSLIEAVRYALENNPDASRAYDRVCREHTYNTRIRTVLDQLGI